MELECLQKIVYYIRAWKSLSEQGKLDLERVGQYLLEMRYVDKTINTSFKSSQDRNEMNAHWNNLKDLMFRLKTLLQGVQRCMQQLQTMSVQSQEEPLLATLSLTHFIDYIKPLLNGLERDYLCKQQVLSHFHQYASRDILFFWINLWWKQPLINPIALEFVIGAIEAEIAVAEEPSEKTRQSTHSSRPKQEKPSQSIVSYLLS
eukprot:jgi/Galph1/1265/GphlegSOOS_G6084.1